MKTFPPLPYPLFATIADLTHFLSHTLSLTPFLSLSVSVSIFLSVYLSACKYVYIFLYRSSSFSLSVSFFPLSTSFPFLSQLLHITRYFSSFTYPLYTPQISDHCFYSSTLKTFYLFFLRPGGMMHIMSSHCSPSVMVSHTQHLTIRIS